MPTPAAMEDFQRKLAAAQSGQQQQQPAAAVSRAPVEMKTMIAADAPHIAMPPSGGGGHAPPQGGGYAPPQGGGYAPPPSGAGSYGGYGGGAPSSDPYGAPPSWPSQQVQIAPTPGKAEAPKGPNGTLILGDSNGIIAIAVEEAKRVREKIVEAPPVLKAPGVLFWTGWVVLGIGIGLSIHFIHIHSQIAAATGT